MNRTEEKSYASNRAIGASIDVQDNPGMAVSIIESEIMRAFQRCAPDLILSIERGITARIQFDGGEPTAAGIRKLIMALQISLDTYADATPAPAQSGGDSTEEEQ